METTTYEIDKLKLFVYETHYEDFVKEPHGFIQNLMEYLQLPRSVCVDSYMQNIIVANRNNRSAAARTPFSEETKKQILAIVAKHG